MCFDVGWCVVCLIVLFCDLYDVCYLVVIEEKDKNMWKCYVVKKNECVLLMSEGDFVKVLELGVFKVFDLFKCLLV